MEALKNDCITFTENPTLTELSNCLNGVISVHNRSVVQQRYRQGFYSALNDDRTRTLPRSTAEEIQAHNKEIIDAIVQFIAENLQSNPTIATEGTLFQNPSYFEDRILDTSSIIESPFCESDKTYIVDTIGLSNTNPPYRVAHMRENKPGTTNSNDNNLPQHTMQYDELSRMIRGNM